MATEFNLHDETYRVRGDMRSNQFYCVEFIAARQVQICSSVTALVCGVIQNNPNSGDSASVRHAGISKAVCGSGITVGDLVGPLAMGAIGKKTAGTDTTNYVIGQAIETASSGEVVSIIIGAVPFRAA